jgi:PAS domain S-box-containing protein
MPLARIHRRVSCAPVRVEREIVGVGVIVFDTLRERGAETHAGRLTAIVDSPDDAVIAKNLDGTITSWNQGAQRIFGYTAGEIIGRSVLTLIPPERQAEEPVIIAKLRRGERLDHYETIRLHKDGRRLDVSLTVSPVRNEQGEIVGASKIARDITARKRAEAQQHALAEMIARVNRAAALPEIYDAALGAIQRCLQADRVSILLDEEGQGMRLVAWRGLSETYRAAAGVPAFWKPGEPNLESVIIEDVRKAELAPPWRALLESEGVRSLAFVPLTYERRLRGELILHYNQPRRFTASELEMAAALAAQIAFAVERQQGALALEALVADRTQSLRQAIGQMEEFSNSVSHDLRSPVRAMQGYAEAVLEDYGDRLDDHGRDMLARIGRAGRRMDQLIRDLLTYSRLSRREMMLEPVSLARLIPEVVQQYPEMHAERATIEIAPDLPAVLAHEPSLTQVVSNLLSNAVKFVAPGTRPHIRVTAGRHGDRVRVNFQDNGVGIPPEYQHRLFGMFERLHTERSYDGTGIGLAIVRKAVERMNGQVGMDSDGMQGSRFWIELNAPQPAIRPDARPPVAE